jgi:hypothetical protein
MSLQKMGWIRCTARDGSSVFINLRRATSIRQEGEHTRIWFSGARNYNDVQETPEQVVATARGHVPRGGVTPG